MKRVMTEELQEEIADAIVTKAQGMFLWASLQLDEVVKGSNKTKIRKALQNMPESIYEVFQKTMSRISNDFATRTLLWLACAKKPLGFTAISHGLVMEVYDDEDGIEDEAMKDMVTDDIPTIEELVEACCGLVSTDGNKNLRFAHFSIREYFVENIAVFAPLTEQHIALSCLAYLSLPVFEDGYQDNHWKIYLRLQKYPLYFYAATMWHTHVPHGAPSPAIERAALKVYSHAGLFCSYSQVFCRQLSIILWRGLPAFVCNDICSLQEGLTPLHNAVELHLPSIARRLLEHGLDPPGKTDQNTTLLQLAVRDNNDDLVKLNARADRFIRGLGPPLLSGVKVKAPRRGDLRWPYRQCTATGLALRLRSNHITDILLSEALLEPEAAGDVPKNGSQVV